MKRKHLLFYLLLIACMLIVGKTVKILANGFGYMPDSALHYLWKTVPAIIVIIGSWLVAKKYDLLYLGGFSDGRRNNYWLLVLPLFFPGILLFNTEKIKCLDATLLYAAIGGKVIISALMEECLFRGVILTHMIKNNPNRSIHFSCIMASIFFSLVHLVNLQVMAISEVISQLVYAFMMGMFFSALLLRVGNVWLLGIVHGLLNMFSKNFCENEIMQAGESFSGTSGTFYGVLLFFLVLSPVLIMYFLLLSGFKNKLITAPKKKESVYNE